MLSVVVVTVLLSAAAIPDAPSSQAGGQVQRESATAPRDSTADKKGTAIIRGRVTSAEGGRPLRRVQIRVMAPELTDARTVSTNSQGRYEVRDLPGGRYTIRVTRSGYLPLEFGQRRPLERGRPVQVADGQAMDHVDFALPRMGVISGRVTDEVGEPIAGVSVWAFQSRYFQGRRQLVPNSGAAQTDDTGQYRLLALPPGDYVIRASIRETWIMDGEEKQTLAFAPTFFPGMTTASDAQRVRVDVGQEVTAIDFALTPGRAAKVSGSVMTSQGVPLAGESISITQETIGPNMSSMSSFGGSKTAADGSFTIKDLPPGDYKLEARLPALKDRPGEFAMVPITLTGADIEGILLTTGAGGDLSGSVTTESGAPLPSGSTRLRVGARAVNMQTTPRFGVAAGSPDNGRVNDDGTFEFKGAFGQVHLTLAGVASGWYLKAVNVGDRDVVDTPVELRAGQSLSGVQFVLSNRPTRVAGRLTDAKGNPTADGTVLLFSADSARWGENSRYIASVRPDQQGLFEHTGLPAGEYLAVPRDYIAEGDANDPEVLEKLKEGATKFTLIEGGREVVNLTLK